jgi:hypothetical protein
MTLPEDHLKCPCKHCGQHIEFPQRGVGQRIPCPNCGKSTELFWSVGLAEAKPVAPRRKRSRPILFAVLGCLAAVVAGMGFLAWKKSAGSPQEMTATAESSGQSSVPQIKPGQDSSPEDLASSVDTWDGLRPSAITLEKSNGSRLIYAMGTVHNQSSRQRFGVKVELDLLDAQETKIGSATDYIQVIEPGKDWKFRAMVTEPKAVRAKITAIKEE